MKRPSRYEDTSMSAIFSRNMLREKITMTSVQDGHVT